MKTPGHIHYTGPGPRQFYDCPLAKHCKAQAVACESFAQFIFTGLIINPRREIIPGNRYRRIQVTDKVIDPVPTRKIYDNIYNSRKAA